MPSVYLSINEITDLNLLTIKGVPLTFMQAPHSGNSSSINLQKRLKKGAEA